MLPQVILLPFSGVIVDKVSRSTLMMITESMRCLLVVALAALSLLDHLSIAAIPIFVIAYAVMDALFQPAYAAARVRYLPKTFAMPPSRSCKSVRNSLA
ncbi:MFS transporter [Alicyclobacillus fastidiosus]|uniref:MFS transporter n=1 Tax=Alicyclobacillus fastidiosus TaxID=392011 RepID=A0ABV5AIQ0_9BACL|nr:MFS transporter [Alicyclobacillus fastidiosus]WEH07788.1 MFS transporter [Alicyclobacillus fastidiosus]